MSDFNEPHNEENQRLKKLLALYEIPKNRLNFLRGVETLCGVREGSCVMYCPHDASMNAKVAKVNLLIEGDVKPFDKYEADQGNSGLTRGALNAQVNRFYELWSAHIFMHRSSWDRLTAAARLNLQSVIKRSLFHMDPTEDLQIARSQMEYSVRAIREETLQAVYRACPGNSPAVEKFKGFTFPSGMPFDIHE